MWISLSYTCAMQLLYVTVSFWFGLDEVTVDAFKTPHLIKDLDMNRSAIAWPRSVGGRGALPAAPGTSRRHLDLAAHIYHLRFWPIYICLILHDPLKGAPVAIRSSPRLFTPAPTTKPVHAGGFQTTDGTVEAST